jgi:hypothetical protein
MWQLKTVVFVHWCLICALQYLHFLKCAVPLTLLFYESKFKTNGTELFKNVNNYLNTNIYSHLETSVGQSFNPYLIEVHFFNSGLN